MDLNLDSFPDNFNIVVFENGKEVERLNVNKKHQLHDFLFSWLEQNQKKWKADLTTYVPSLLINSDKFKANFLFADNLVVVNFKNHNGTWLQVSKYFESSGIQVIKSKFKVDLLSLN